MEHSAQIGALKCFGRSGDKAIFAAWEEEAESKGGEECTQFMNGWLSLRLTGMHTHFFYRIKGLCYVVLSGTVLRNILYKEDEHNFHCFQSSFRLHITAWLANV